MRVIVTAAALIITPGVELKLTPEDAKLRKHCMTHVAGGVYRATLENHYKTGVRSWSLRATRFRNST